MLADPAGFPADTALIGRLDSAATTVHQAAGATLALVLLAGGAALFLAATAGRLATDGSHRSRINLLTTVQGVGLAVTFAALAYQVRIGGWVTDGDAAVLGWFTGHRSEWVTGPAIAITDAGGPVGTVLMAVLLGVVVSRRMRSVIPGVIVVGTVGGAALASTVTKMVIGRARPPIVSQVLLETDYSFPSGHATGAMALFSLAAVLIGYRWPAGRRRVLVAAAFALTVVVAVTRLYLGEHWLTDVLGGVVLGGLAALIGATLHATWMRRTHPTAVVDDAADPPQRPGRPHPTPMGRAA